MATGKFRPPGGDEFRADDAGGGRHVPGKPGLPNVVLELSLVAVYFQGMKVLCQPNKWAVGWEAGGAVTAALACAAMIAHGRRAIRRAGADPRFGGSWRTVGVYSLAVGLLGVLMIPVAFVVVALGEAMAAG